MSQLSINDMIGGDPQEIANELEEFSKSAKVLSSSRERLIKTHEKKWIGLHKGKVEIVGNSIKSVLSQLASKGLDPDETIVRFIDRDLKTLIL